MAFLRALDRSLAVPLRYPAPVPDLLAELLAYLERDAAVPLAWAHAHALDGDLQRFLRNAWDGCHDARVLLGVAARAADPAAVGLAACACAARAVTVLGDASLRRALDIATAWHEASARLDGGALADSMDARAAALDEVRARTRAFREAVSFADQALASAVRAVLGALADAPAQSVAMDAANAIACASEPADRDTMRDRRIAALQTLADVVRTHVPCPTLEPLPSGSFARVVATPA